MLTFMGQRLVPHLGYRQKQAKLFNHIKTQGNIEIRNKFEIQITKIQNSFSVRRGG